MSEEPEKKRRRRRRRRRRDDPDRAGFAALLPQLLTTGNLASGFYAIVMASSGNVLVASYAIFVAALFDILDGRAARMTGNVSRFGAEYDSIADTVSFGVAPAILAFYAGDFASLGWAGWVLAFTYTACASLRLARFNVQSGRFEGRFDGVPTPAGAGMIVSTVWFKNVLVGPDVSLGLPAIIPAVGVAFLGLLMVSPIPYHSGKNLRFGQSYSTTVISLIVLLLLIWSRTQLLPRRRGLRDLRSSRLRGAGERVDSLIPAEEKGPPGQSAAEAQNVTPITGHASSDGR